MEKDIETEIRLKHLCKEVENLNILLDTFPEGTLHIVHNGNYTKYYQYFGRGNMVYINKEHRGLAVLLWEKALVMEMIADRKKRIANMSAYIAGTEGYSDVKKSRLFACELAEEGMMHLATLDASEFIYETEQRQLQIWARSSYIKNTRYPEELKYSSPGGIKLRSKSEKLIAIALESHQIPYRYECRFGEYEIFPDFTIKRPMDGEILIWEHFGLWDNGGYRSDALRKIDTYARAGYCPDRNLIMTFETRAQPFSNAEEIVNRYLV